MVVNLSDSQLMPDDTAVLARGGKFIVRPRYLLVEDVISSVKVGAHELL